MTDTSYKTDKTTMVVPPRGGYESLVVYWLAVTIYDLNKLFIDHYIDRRSRTHDQMHQAARSGKQNIVEGSLEPSIESNLKLTGVARASFAELLEDYRDYLREHNLPIWDKDDPRIVQIRRERDVTYKSYKTYTSYMSYTINPERFANMMITLCFKQGYLLDHLLRAIEKKFITEGGFREKLFRKRIEYRTSHNHP